MIALAVALTTAAVLTGCFKSNDNQTVPLSQKQKYLTQKAWTIQSITMPNPANPAQDSSIMKSCHSQALIAFGVPVYSDGSGDFLYKDQAGGCDSTVFPFGQGVWIFTTGEDSLLTRRYFAQTGTFESASKIRRMKLLALDSTVLKVRLIDSMPNNPTAVKTITFVH